MDMADRSAPLLGGKVSRSFMHIFSIYNSLLSIVWGNWKP